MSSESERFIELAVRPFDANAELKLAAAGELRRRIEAQAAPDELIRESAAALERADQHPRRRYWRVALYLTTLLVSLPVIVQSMRQPFAFHFAREITSFFSREDYETQNSVRERLTHQQRLLIFGDESAVTDATRWKPLWDSAPDNPAYLAAYANAYFSDHKNLSPEILKAAERIDPNNGWFLALSAGGIAEGAVTKEKLNTKEQKEFKTPVWKINDPNKLQETLQLIHQAMQKPEFRSYEKELLTQRIPLLPKRTDCVSQIASYSYIAGQTACIDLRKLVDAWCAGAQECASNRDTEGFQSIVRDWEALCSRQIANGLTLVDLLVARVLYLGPAENFRDAAQLLGLDPEAERFAKLLETKKAEKSARDQRGRGFTSEHIATIRGSYLATLSLPILGRQVQNPPPLSEADLRPSRYAEHALIMRVFAMAIWGLLGLAAGLAALHRFLQNPLVRMQSVRMLDLLKASDWTWILLGGVLVPVVWYQGFIYLTPLSSREWSFMADDFVPFHCQTAAMILLTLTLTAVLCGSRLAQRGAAIGLSACFHWLGWIAAFSAALALPASGAALPAAFSDGPMKGIANYLPWLGFVLLGIPALWLLVGFSRTVLGRHVHALRRATLARMLIPAWIFGMLVMMIAIPIYHAEERHWIQQDKLFEITADAPAMSRYEWDVTQQLRKELLEMIR